MGFQVQRHPKFSSVFRNSMRLSFFFFCFFILFMYIFSLSSLRKMKIFRTKENEKITDSKLFLKSIFFFFQILELFNNFFSIDFEYFLKSFQNFQFYFDAVFMWLPSIFNFFFFTPSSLSDSLDEFQFQLLNSSYGILFFRFFSQIIKFLSFNIFKLFFKLLKLICLFSDFQLFSYYFCPWNSQILIISLGIIITVLIMHKKINKLSYQFVSLLICLLWLLTRLFLDSL